MTVMDEVEKLIGTLQFGSVEERKEAAIRLGTVMKDARTVEPLINALGDADSDVRYWAARALREQGDESAAEPLIVALKDDEPNVRGKAAEALGEIKDAKAVGLLIGMLKDDSTPLNRSVRGHAAIALGNLKDARAVGPLIEALSCADSWVHMYAAEALGKIGEPAVKPLIAEAAKPEKKALRGTISGILRKIDEGRREKPRDLGCVENERLKPPEIPPEFQRLVLRDVPKAKIA